MFSFLNDIKNKESSIRKMIYINNKFSFENDISNTYFNLHENNLDISLSLKYIFEDNINNLSSNLFSYEENGKYQIDKTFSVGFDINENYLNILLSLKHFLKGNINDLPLNLVVSKENDKYEIIFDSNLIIFLELLSFRLKFIIEKEGKHCNKSLESYIKKHKTKSKYTAKELIFYFKNKEVDFLFTNELKDLILNSVNEIEDRKEEIFLFFKEEENLENLLIQKKEKLKKETELDIKNFNDIIVNNVSSKFPLANIDIDSFILEKMNATSLEVLLKKYNKPIKFDFIQTSLPENLFVLNGTSWGKNFFEKTSVQVSFTKKRINYKINGVKTNKEELSKQLNKQFYFNDSLATLENFDKEGEYIDKFIDFNKFIELIN
jgi:hypothetical protein